MWKVVIGSTISELQGRTFITIDGITPYGGRVYPLIEREVAHRVLPRHLEPGLLTMYKNVAEEMERKLNSGVGPEIVADQTLDDRRMDWWVKSPWFGMDENSRRISQYLKWRMEGVGEK